MFQILALFNAMTGQHARVHSKETLGALCLFLGLVRVDAVCRRPAQPSGRP